MIDVIKIPVASLISDFRRMLDEKWRYSWSAAEEGCVSCSGAFTWAYRQHGKTIYQGSNRIAREHVVKLIPTTEAIRIGSVRAGMAAIKMRAQGEKGYNLPDAYKPGGDHYNGDLGDYYHIGLVDTDCAHVLNAQSEATGFVSSNLDKTWDCVAYLTDVDYDGQEEEGMTQARVTGGRLKLRQDPSSSAKVLDMIPDGSVVDVIGDSGSWLRVAWAGKTGYCMADYLVMIDPGESPITDIGGQMVTVDGQTVTIKLPMETALQLRDALISALGLG